MQRLIDANAAADKIMHEVEVHADEIGMGAVAIVIAFARALRDETDFPTIEAEPVRHGQWIPYTVGRENGFTNVFVCSECGKSVRFIMSHEQCPYDGCPYCFARMNGGMKE